MVSTLLMRVFKNERGASMMEYALLLSLIAVVVISAMTVVGKETKGTFFTVGQKIKEAGVWNPVPPPPPPGG